MKHRRIQRKRTRGWKSPPNCRYVGRPTQFGNHHVVIDGNHDNAVYLYRHWFYSDAGKNTRMAVHRELYGKTLSCFCRLDQPCHADVLIEYLDKMETP